AAGNVIDEEGFRGSEILQLLHVLNRLVSHRRRQVPARIPLERIDGGRIAIEVRLPLAGIAAAEAVEVVEAHAARPLVKGSGLSRLIRRRVVVLAEPRGRVAVCPEDGADG